MTTATPHIDFGALAPAIIIQLDKQGLTSAKELDWVEVQKDAAAVNRLYVCGLLSSADLRRIEKKFVSRLKLRA